MFPQGVNAVVSAEIDLLRAELSRLLRRAVYACIGLVFALLAVAGLHVAAFLFIIQSGQIGPVWAALIMLAADMVIVIVAALLVAGVVPSQAEREALEDRRRARASFRQSISIVARVGGAAVTAREWVEMIARSRSKVVDPVVRRDGPNTRSL